MSNATRPLYLVGGRRSATNPNAKNFVRGVVLLKNETGIHLVTEYRSPPELRMMGEHTLFKGATRLNDLLYCCTRKEIVVYQLPGFEEVRHFSHPLFADVHYVIPLDYGGLLVAVANLEIVLEFDGDGNIVNEHNMSDEALVIDRDLDYRLERHDGTPPRAHLNHLVTVNGEVFVTRLIKKDAVSLSDNSRRIDLGDERVHDGYLFGSELYFTSVNGSIIVVDPVTLAETDRYPLATGSWCRGLLVDADSTWVGFTRRDEADMSIAPTRIARYDLADGSLLEEIDLEPYGMDAIYSIIDATP